MSRPRNTWRESAEMISEGTPSERNRRAMAIARPDFPVAVAPAITSSGGAGAIEPTSASVGPHRQSRAALDRLAVPELNDAIGEVDERRVVRGHDRRHALVAHELLEQLHDRAP